MRPLARQNSIFHSKMEHIAVDSSLYLQLSEFNQVIVKDTHLSE